jgi:nucleoside phosphorylase
MLRPTGELLIVAAHELELQPLRQRLASAGVHLPNAVVGVGMAAAAAGTARALERTGARRVVLVGSCVGYPGSGLPLLSLLAVRGSVLVDAATLDGRAALPEAMPQRCACDRDLHELLTALPGVHDGTVATSLSITTDDALGRALEERSGCTAENLEVLAVGLACATHAACFGALLCCTNQVGARGRAEWAMHSARAAELTADAVMRCIAR